MKITDWIIIFFIAILFVIAQTDSRVSELSALTKENNSYNRKLDDAVSDALENLVEVDTGGETIINKEESISNFFDSLYANFGVLDNKLGQEMIRNYIPVIEVTVNDGYYIMYNSVEKVDNVTKIVQQWTEKRPFSYRSSNGVILFSTDGTIRVMIDTINEVYSGDPKTLLDKYDNDINLVNYYNSSVLSYITSDYSKFDAIRRTTITNSIVGDLNYYVNNHNRIAELYGISYNFSLPIDVYDSFDRTVDDVSMLVLFQGYPYRSDDHSIYNRVAFGGARSHKASGYIVSKDTNGIYYYHKPTCSHADTNSETVYSTKSEAAKTGAYSCPYCKP